MKATEKSAASFPPTWSDSLSRLSGCHYATWLCRPLKLTTLNIKKIMPSSTCLSYRLIPPEEGIPCMWETLHITLYLGSAAIKGVLLNLMNFSARQTLSMTSMEYGKLQASLKKLLKIKFKEIQVLLSTHSNNSQSVFFMQYSILIPRQLH